jgi:hypothetical protein
MNRKKISLGLILFLLGMAGVASILTMELPLPPEAEAILKERFTDDQIKLLLLINPSLMLGVAVVMGTYLFRKVHLRVPIVEKAVGLNDHLNLMDIIKFGLSGGIIAGSAISLTGWAFLPVLPEEFLQLSDTLKPSLAARFLYGGITEEILMRFGLMTFIVWLLSEITKKTSNGIYVAGIIAAALLFAFGHFPIAYQAIENPSSYVLAYIMIGNTLGGIVFGWLYWKKGLESAFLAHMMAHVVMVAAEPFLMGNHG